MEPQAEQTAAAPTGRGAKAIEVLTTLLGHLGVAAQIEARENGDDVALRVQVSSGGEPVGLAEPRSPLWEPIGYLVGKMINRDPSKRCWVSIHTGAELPPPGTPVVDERDEELVKLGKFLAERAKALGKVLVVGPMGPRERRSIHLAVKEVGGVTSRSEGDGVARRLLVVPDKLAAPAPEGA